MTSIRIDGETPAGGAYSVLVTMDADMREVPEEEATHATITEYDVDGNWVAESFGELHRGQ